MRTALPLLTGALILFLQIANAWSCDRALADAYEQKARDAGGNHEARIRHFRNALDVCPKRPATYVELGETLLLAGRTKEAEATIRQGLKFGSKHSGVRRVYGDVLRKMNELPEALSQYELAVEFAVIPRDRFYALAHKGWAHHGLGQHTGSTRSWMDALAIGIVFDPVINRRLYNMVAWNLAVCRTSDVCDGPAAVRFYEMNPVRHRTWYELGTGAAAYARAGDFDAAVRLQQQSLALLEKTDTDRRDEWAEDAGERLAMYRQGKPYTGD